MDYMTQEDRKIIRDKFGISDQDIDSMLEGANQLMYDLCCEVAVELGDKYPDIPFLPHETGIQCPPEYQDIVGKELERRIREKAEAVGLPWNDRYAPKIER